MAQAQRSTNVIQAPLGANRAAEMLHFPAGTTVAEAAEIFKAGAPEFRVIPRLFRKYCLFGGAGKAIGVCLWEDRSK